MIAEPSLLDNCGNPRIELFQLFIKIFNSVSINQRTGSADIPRPPEQRLATLTALPRQAFLLMVLEGFSEEDGAKILECDIPTLRRLVDDFGARAYRRYRDRCSNHRRRDTYCDKLGDSG